MKRILGTSAAALAAVALAGSLSAFEISPAMQKELAHQAEIVKSWAAHPVIVKAVLDQNEKGPIPGMTNETWKSVRRSDELVKALAQNPAGRLLVQKLGESNGLYVRAFLSAAKGEKAAFSEKTISYLHAGQAKFDVPFTTGRTWEGPPELDIITEKHDVQIAAPVLSGGKPVGVLIVGVNLAQLEKVSGKK